MSDGRFLQGSTMGHVVRMTATGALGVTFVFLVDAANLFWIAQLGEPQLVAAIGFAFAIQFFSVSSGVGLMIAATAIISRSIGAGERAQARRQGRICDRLCHRDTGRGGPDDRSVPPRTGGICGRDR